MKTINGILNRILSIDIFKLVFLTSCFFYCIPFTNTIFVSLFKLFILWGGATFLYNFFCNKNYTLKKADYLLFAFLAVAGVGCFLGPKQNLVQNVTAVAYLFVQTVLMVSYNRTSSLDQKVKEIKRFANVAVILTFPCAVTSILIFLLNFKYSLRMGFQQYVFGVFEGRLWGIQGNPNTLAQFALISIWLSIILLLINKKYGGKKGQRVFLYTNIVLQIICCVLSNSRSTTIGAAVAIGFLALVLIGLKKRKADQTILKALFKNSLTSLLKLGCVAVCVVLVFVTVKQGMKIASIPFKNVDLDFLPVYEEETPEDTEENKPQTNVNKTEREYLTDDYSNGRFEIWQGAAKVILKNPIFGVGEKNINDNVNPYLSDATVSSTPKLAANMHNIYLQVTIAHGIPAFLLFFVYLLCVVFKLLKFLFTFKSDNENHKFIFKLVAMNACIISSLLVINLFDSNIVYFCLIFLVPVFWNAIASVNSLLDSFYSGNDSKKVLIMVDSLETGGTEKALIELAKRLDYSKYDISVKTIYNEGKYIKDLDENIKYDYVIKRPNFLNKRIFYRLVKYLPAKLLYNFMVNGVYDVEIAFHELLSTKILSGSVNDCKKIAWIHTNVFADKNNHQMFLNHKGFVKGYDSFDKIVCVSENLRQSFKEKTGLDEKTETIYNPIDVSGILENANEECDLQKQEGKFLIVSIGRLEKVKGYGKLLEAFEELSLRHSNLELWILGEGSERKAYEKFIEENNLTQTVKLIGFKSNPYNYLKQADLFISTSEIEGFSLAVAEAVVLGLPVISTSTDGPKEILENGKYGMLIEGDAPSITEAIESVLQSDGNLNLLKEKSALRKEYFEKFDTISRVESLILS